MTMIDRKTVSEKYDEISRLETSAERREFFGGQSVETRVALWLENIERKTMDKEFSAEQIEILDAIREKFVTVEFFNAATGKLEEEADPEYLEIMEKANELLGRENVRELFGILGDNATLKSGC